jgi:hypothetical protein
MSIESIKPNEEALPSPIQPLTTKPSESLWTEWEEGPVQVGIWDNGHLRAPPSTVKQWRFRKVLKRWQCMIQVKLWEDCTVTRIVHCSNLREVWTKQREADDLWTVQLDHDETHGWSPTEIKFYFDKEENALAFHVALLAHLS